MTSSKTVAYMWVGDAAPSLGDNDSTHVSMRLADRT